MLERRLHCQLTVFFFVVIAPGSGGGVADPGWTRTADGLVVYPDGLFTTYKTDLSLKWDVSPNDSEVVLKTRLPIGKKIKHTLVLTYTGGEKILSLR
jgi:hypothetical protein